MYNVSEEYLTEVMKRSVSFSWYGYITTAAGKSYDFDAKNMADGQSKIIREICTSDKLEIGTTCAAELTLGVYLDADRYEMIGGTIKPTFRLMFEDGGYEDVPCGEFTITDASRSGNLLTMHAYDHMERFNMTYGGGALIGTPIAMLKTACRTCNVELGQTDAELMAMLNSTVTTWVYSPEDTVSTWRDLVGYVAQMLCACAIIGADGKLYLKQYGMTPDRTIPVSWRYKSEFGDYETKYVALDATYIEGKAVEHFDLGGTGLTYDLGQNPIIQMPLKEARERALNNILTKLGEITYTPFDIDTPTDPSLFPGDVLAFTGGNVPEGKVCAITSIEIKTNGGMTIKGVGENPRLKVETETDRKIKAISASVDKDTMHYYDFQNTEEYLIEDGGTAEIINFHYITNKVTHIDFHAEAKYTLDTTETTSDEEDGDEIITDTDGVLKVSYKLNGEEVNDYYPMETEVDGTHLLHLLFTWTATQGIIGDFQVYLNLTGAKAHIEMGDIRAYIAGEGLIGDGEWDGNVNVNQDFKPINFHSWMGKYADKVETSLQTPETPTFTEQFKTVNFHGWLGHFSGSVNSIYDLHRFDVDETDRMTLDGVVRSDRVWKLADGMTTGTITTPNCEVARIRKVTSTKAGDDVSYVVSFDGGETWWTYSGGWSEPDYTSALYGMNEATLESISSAKWAEKLNGYVMIRAILLNEATVSDFQIYMSGASDWAYLSSREVVSYDAKYVVVGEKETHLQTDYEYSASEQSVDTGRMESVEIDTSVLSRIDEIDVEVDDG